MDRTSFLGQTVPQEVRAIATPLATVDQKLFRKILEFVVENLKGEEITNAHLTELQRATDEQTSALVPTFFSGIHYIVRSAIRTKVSLEHLQVDLNEIKFPAACTQDIAKVLQKGRAVLEEQAFDQRIRFPTVSSLKWRVDVMVSSSFTSRVLTPVVLMEATASDGAKNTFELSLDKFHELRYNVAKVLKDMEDLEQNPILKIDK